MNNVKEKETSTVSQHLPVSGFEETDTLEESRSCPQHR